MIHNPRRPGPIESAEEERGPLGVALHAPVRVRSRPRRVDILLKVCFGGRGYVIPHQVGGVGRNILKLDMFSDTENKVIVNQEIHVSKTKSQYMLNLSVTKYVFSRVRFRAFS